MQKSNISFTKAQLDSLFPLYILINKDLTIHSCGSSFIPMYGNCIGHLFSTFITIKSPKQKETNLQLQLLCGQEVVFKIGKGGNKQLKGRLEFLEATHQFVFLGMPEKVINTDIIEELKAKEAENESLKLEIAAFRAKKAQLQKEAKAVRDIALFPIENPDPLFRIHDNGSIILKNKPAKKITKLCYKGKHYKTDIFFKEVFKAIVNQNTNLSNRYTFEVLANNKTYSFICRRIASKKYFNIYGRDITEEKRIGNTTNISELKFWIALEKIYENAWEHDFVKDKTYFSKSNNDFWGYTNSEETNSGNIWWNSINIDDRHLLEETYAKYLSKEIDSHNLEYRIFHKNGTMKWVMDRGVVLERDKDGKPLRTIGTHTDITQNKLTETELEQRVKQFKSLSENIPGVIYEYEFRQDGTEGFRYISPAIERLFGIKPDDFNNYLNYINPEDRDRILQKNEYSKQHLQSFYDESVLNVPGAGLKWHAVYLSFSYIDQNGAKVFTGFIMDITERKNAEDILRANEEKYRSIIANMKLGLIEMDNQANVVYINNSFCDMSGYAVEELIGKNASTLFINEKNTNTLAQKIKMPENGVADAYQVEMIDKNGNLNWWLVSAAPRYNDNGQKLGSIGIYLDISEQKKLERELIMAREQAEQSANTKEIFLANMSHEMRTPMNAIIGMSNQLAKTKLAPQQRFFLDTVHSAADNLLIIINDILDLSKIEAGKLSLENLGFEPRVLLKKTIQFLAHKAEEKGLEINNAYFDEKIANVLIGDIYRLNQVLLNLVSNAIKFTEKGSICISFVLEKNTKSSQLIAIEVTDTGIGMDESFIDTLFDKFSQEYESVSRKFGGTGLGMSICKELIVLMGGDIIAKSKKGKGTTITFRIEFKKGTKAQLPKDETIQISSNVLKGKKILITDDNDLNRLVASMILKDYGAEIIEASNGQQAIAKFRVEKCDIILMDIQMPELNGYDTTKLLRKTGSTIPIIALTANAIKGENEKCLAAGMNDYIAKPFKEKELLIKIAKWLNTKVVIVKKQPKVKAAAIPPLYNLYKLRNMSAENELFVKEMVQMFCEQTPEMLKDMVGAYNTNNFERMGFFAHKMRSSIDSFDIQVLKKGIKEIEAIGLGKQQDSSSLPELINEIEVVIVKIIEELAEMYPAEN